MQVGLVTMGLVLLTACAQMRADAPELDEIISRLKSPEEAVRAAAGRDLAKLKQRGLSEQEGLRALRAAAESYPTGKPEIDFPGTLVEAAMPKNPRPAYVPVIGEFFGKYTDRARLEALWILIKSNQRPAAEAYVHLVEKYGAELSRLPSISPQREPRDVDVYLRLLPMMKHDRLAGGIALMMLNFAEANLAPRDQLIECEADLLRAYQKRRELVLARQREDPAGISKDDYAEWREDAGIFLDLMGYIPTDQVRKELRAAMAFADPLPKSFAIQSLLMLGEKVDAKDVEDVAAFPEKRCLLLNILKKSKQEALFPAKYKTQAKLAEGNMVNWLAYPTELGKPPDEIELMKVVTIDTPEGVSDYYLFRFRTLGDHWAAKDGWMAGVTGPYLKRDQPTTTDGGDTFSTFSKWESKTPDEHVEAIRKLIAESWKQRARELEKK